MDEYTYQAMWDLELSFNMLCSDGDIESLVNIVKQYKELEEQWRYA